MKWFACALVLFGIIAIAVAYRMNRTASFEGGSFTAMMVLGIVGVVAIVLGVVIFIADVMWDT